MTLPLTPLEVEQAMYLVDCGVIYVHTFAYISSDEDLTKAIRRVILNRSHSKVPVAEASYVNSIAHGRVSTGTCSAKYSPLLPFRRTLRQRTTATAVAKLI